LLITAGVVVADGVQQQLLFGLAVLSTIVAGVW
jgi:hypothetical protein